MENMKIWVDGFRWPVFAFLVKIKVILEELHAKVCGPLGK